MELYKKYRPRSLDRVIGNDETVASLRNMIARKSLPHVILFHGPPGCGKTSLARIVASMLECADLDFQELNSSSFRGIDTIRELSRSATLVPVAGPCRIWLCDEVHKWTNDAQNAALKLLEDTPQSAYFLLCTTDPQKLIKPVRSRCCEMPVRPLTDSQMESLLKRVVAKEQIEISSDALETIVLSASGSARTALVQLDRVRHLSSDQMERALAEKVGEETEAIELCRALLKRQPWKKVVDILKTIKVDPEAIRWAVLGYAKAVLLSSGNPDRQAFFVIESFSEPFYESKEAGLVAACYDCIFGGT